MLQATRGRSKGLWQSLYERDVLDALCHVLFEHLVEHRETPFTPFVALHVPFTTQVLILLVPPQSIHHQHERITLSDTD